MVLLTWRRRLNADAEPLLPMAKEGITSACMQQGHVGIEMVKSARRTTRSEGDGLPSQGTKGGAYT